MGFISRLFSSSGFRIPNRLTAIHALKIAVLVIAAIVFLHTTCLAMSLTLKWDPNVDQDLAGYIVYYGTGSGDYQYDVDIGEETSVSISGLVDGKKYYFAVTAYDEEGNESAYSAEIAYPNSGPSGPSGGGGGGGCFVSSAADGRWSTVHLLTFIGVLLVGIFGMLIYRRVRLSADLSDA